MSSKIFLFSFMIFCATASSANYIKEEITHSEITAARDAMLRMDEPNDIIATISSVIEEEDTDNVLERLLANREDRRVEFQHRLDDIHHQLHETPQDERLQRKAVAYEKKLESLNDALDQRQLDHLMAQEELLFSNSVVKKKSKQSRLRGFRRVPSKTE